MIGGLVMAYRKTFEVVGFTIGDGAMYCSDCTNKILSTPSASGVRNEDAGMVLTAVFLGDTSADDACDVCRVRLDA
jgi:hypothetical protein